MCCVHEMLRTQLPDALRAVGFTEQQVAHALREGGPLDDIRHRTWCDQCNLSAELTLRELLGRQGLCKCGGHFHIGDRSRNVVDDIAGRLMPGAGL